LERNARSRRRTVRRRRDYASTTPLKRRDWRADDRGFDYGIRWRENGKAVVPPCWAADPWLKLWLKGGVPVGTGSSIDYTDSTGETAVKLIERPDLRPLYLDETGPGVPISKPHDQQEYRHSVFDYGLVGGRYQRLVLALGKW
jgi:hypothetical protein